MFRPDGGSLTLIYLVFCVISILFSFLTNGLLLKFSRTLGSKDQGEAVVRWSSVSKPALGGISFFIMFLFGVACHSVIFSFRAFELDVIQFLGVLAACALGFIVGLADDAFNTKPFLKSAAQFACAIILISTGTSINMSGLAWIDYPLTILWVVGLMNSINMLDNMDGITTSVSISIVLATMYMIWSTGYYTSIYFITLLGVLSGLLGFLYYNWNPSKMYMGDTGSQFLGIFLAAVGIIFLWNGHTSEVFRIQTKQFIVPLLVFIIPIIDTTTVTINRLMKGQSPFVGGKDHTTHHLSYMGLTDRQVALTFLGLSLLSAIMLVIIDIYLPANTWDYQHFALFLGYFTVLFTFLYGSTRLKRNNK